MFCSVPHVGSNIASKTSVGAALLFMPTQEVKELSYGNDPHNIFEAGNQFFFCFINDFSLLRTFLLFIFLFFSLGSEELKKLNESFKRIRAERKYKVISFGEARDVTVSSIMVKKLSVQLVPLSSAGN